MEPFPCLFVGFIPLFSFRWAGWRWCGGVCLRQTPLPYFNSKPCSIPQGRDALALGALISPFLGELSALCSHEPLCVSNVESRFLTMLERVVAK